MEKTTKKMPFGRKMGYSVGICADTFGYSLFYSYFSIFLTTVVGVNPAVAGIISSIGILWDGITDPVIGYIADKKPGRRSKLIFWASIPYALSVVLTFTAVNFGSTLNAVYYTVCALAFWLFSTMVCVPYYSAVPELTPDYNERTEVRSFSATINTFANLLTLSFPMVLVNFFGGWTNSVSGGWTLTAVLFGILIVVFCIICSVTLKRADRERTSADIPEQKEKVSLGNSIGGLFKTFFSVLKMKTMLIIFCAIVVINIYRSFTSTGFVYYMVYSIGLDSAGIGLAYTVLVVSWLLYYPIINWMCRKWDRKVCLMVFVAITAVFRTIIAFTPLIYTVTGLYISIFVGNFMTTAYLVLIFAMAYDIAELYEFKNNGRRADSTIQSVPLMAQKIGSSVGAIIWGFALTATGFDAAAPAQTPEAVAKLSQTFCGYINVVLVIFLALFALYKLDKKKVGLIQSANAARKAGESYSSDGFSDVL